MNLIDRSVERSGMFLAALVFYSMSYVTTASDEDYVGAWNRHRSVIEAPTPKFTRAVTGYLADIAERQCLEHQIPQGCLQKPQQSVTGREAAASDMAWVAVSTSLWTKPETPRADKKRAEVCQGIGSIEVSTTALVEKSRQLTEFLRLLTLEEEEFWRAHYGAMSTSERAEIDRLMDLMPDSTEKQRIDFEEIAADAPRSFQLYLLQRCESWGFDSAQPIAQVETAQPQVETCWESNDQIDLTKSYCGRGEMPDYIRFSSATHKLIGDWDDPAAFKLHVSDETGLDASATQTFIGKLKPLIADMIEANRRAVKDAACISDLDSWTATMAMKALNRLNDVNEAVWNLYFVMAKVRLTEKETLALQTMMSSGSGTYVISDFVAVYKDNPDGARRKLMELCHR